MDPRQSLEHKHRELTEGAPDALYTLDSEGRILSANPAAAAFAGCSEEELCGRSILELIAPHERARTAQRIAARFRQGGTADPFIVEVIDRLGRRRTVEVASRILQVAGEAPRLEGLARDVTDRKRAEDALKALAAMTAEGAGDNFYRSVARYVAEMVGVRYAMIGVLQFAPQPQILTLAVWNGNGFEENFAYDLEHTPCSMVVGKEARIYPQNVRRQFPKDDVLERLEAESYIGFPLWNAEGRPLGALALLHTSPAEPTPTQMDVLRILAARTGAEIDRAQATNALRASEERFRQLAEQTVDVVWVFDLPTRRLAYLGPSFSRMTGSPADAGNPSLRAVIRLMHSEDRRRVLQSMRSALRGPTGDYSIEYRVVHKDGSTRWILDQGVVIRDSRGKAVRISGVARDITSRKQAEIALATERARFRDLFENSPDAIFVDSFDGQVLDVNSAACELHRLPRERLIGRHVTELAPASMGDEIRRLFGRLAAGELSLSESVSLRSDDSVVPVELRASRVLHEDRHALLLHVRDISARKGAEDYLAGQKHILEWIATDRPIDEILTELVRITEARRAGLRCWVHWFADTLGRIPAVVAPTFPPALVPSLAELMAETGPLGLALTGSTGQPIVVSNLLAQVPDPGVREALDLLDCHSAIGVPINDRGGRRLGAFITFLPGLDDPPGPTLDLQRVTTSLAGVAIERHLADASLREGAERLRRANSALLELARSETVSRGDLNAALREITEAAARGIGVSRVNVWLFEENDTVLRCLHHFEARSGSADVSLELRIANAPAYFEAITRARLISVSDAELDPRTAELRSTYLQPLGIRAMLDAGIRLRGRLVGVICLEHQGESRTWRNEEELFAGSLADVVALALQASERRCIEEALRQSEEAYRSVVGGLAEGVMLINREGAFVTFNDSAAEILGLTSEFLRRHRLQDVPWDTLRHDGSRLAPEDYPVAITLRSGEPQTDSVLGVRRPDGRLVWLSINTRPFARDAAGNPSSVVVSFADITRRQEAERALREGHQLLQSISEVQARFIADSDPGRTFGHLLATALLMTDSDLGLIGEVIPSADGARELKVYGPLEQQSLGERFQEGGSDAPLVATLPHPLAGLLDSVLHSGQAVILGPSQLESASESGPPATQPAYHLLGLPLRHDEEVVGVVGLARRSQAYDESDTWRLDPLLITFASLIGAIRTDRQREQAEARIRQLNAELEKRVEERTADLRATNQELQEFAYVVTHDLKAPLRGIHQLSEWLSQDHAAQLGPEALRLLGLLRGRVQHLQRMIDGLLACARVGRTPEPESAVPTLSLVREIATVLAPPSNVEIAAAADLPVVWGNPDRLYQIFQNLLDNAVKYLDKPRGHIAVTASRRRGLWEFRVADNGPGIPERYREKVFQIFQRLNPTGDVPGTGLGLTLVKRIVEARGGRIWIESSEETGTSVCFTWPDRAKQRPVA